MEKCTMPKTLILSTLVLLFVLLPTLAAQEVTPQPEQNYIYGWESEVFFPLAIRFQLVLDLPADQVEAALLTLQQAENLSAEININLTESVTTSDPFTVIDYIWQIPAGQPLAFEVPINYTWRVNSADAQTAVVEDSLIFSDWRSLWAQTEQDGFLDLFVPADQLDPDAVQQGLQAVYDLLVRNTGRTSQFSVLLYTADLPTPACTTNTNGESVLIGVRSQIEIPCEDSQIALNLGNLGLDILQIENLDETEVRTRLLPYLVLDFYEEQWRGKDVPAWFQSGLIAIYTPTPKARLFAPLLDAARQSRLYTLPQMGSVLPDDLLWLGQSYGMVLYLVSRFGYEAVFRFADQIEDAASFSDAYMTAFGEAPEVLIASVGLWIFTDGARAAFAVSPYQVATATPTITPTPTATDTPTATHTPTMTPTITDTPTATQTGIPQTALPTRTATFTAVPPTPSLTPRPANSLFTPTPIPTEIPTAAVDDTVIVGLAAVIIIILASLSFFLIRRMR